MTSKPALKFQNIRAVGYQTDEPYVNLSPYCWAFDCPRPGAEVEFLNLTLQVMESTGTIIQIDADIDQSLAMVVNGSADMTLNAARQTLERMEVVDFTTPISFIYYGYLLKEIPEIAVADYIISIFYLDTLALLISFGITVGTLVFIYCWIFDKRMRSLTEWMIVSCAAILRQFMFRISSPVCAIVLIGFWLWCCLVIITYYEAKLKSFLLLSHNRGTIFNTLDGVLDVVEHKGWTIVLQERGYTPYLWCNPSQCARLDKLKSKITYISENDDINDFLSQDKHVGFSALASDLAQNDISYFNYQEKVLFVRDKLMAPEYLAYAVSKNMKGLRESFNRAVALTTSGYNTVRSRYMTSLQPYASTTGQTQMAYVLQTQHFMQLYKFCLFAYCFATLVLLKSLYSVFYTILKYSDTHLPIDSRVMNGGSFDQNGNIFQGDIQLFCLYRGRMKEGIGTEDISQLDKKNEELVLFKKKCVFTKS